MAKWKRLSLSVPEEFYQGVRVAAAQEGMSMSSFVYRLLQHYLEYDGAKNAYREAMGRRPLIEPRTELQS